jgi:hypothetical protein
MTIRALFCYATLLQLFVAHTLVAYSDPQDQAQSGGSSSFRIRLSGLYKNYSDAPPGGGVRAEFSYFKPETWAMRASVYYVHATGHDGAEFRLGGSYWIDPDWVVSLDGQCTTDSYLFPLGTLVAGAAYNLSKELIPKLEFVYSQDTQTQSIFLVPSLTWSPLPALSFEGDLYLGYTFLGANTSAKNLAGSAVTTYSPLKQLTLYLGLTVGNVAFDRFTPVGALPGILATVLFGAVAVQVYEGFGLEGGVAHEWDSNDKRFLTARLSATYKW